MTSSVHAITGGQWRVRRICQDDCVVELELGVVYGVCARGVRVTTRVSVAPCVFVHLRAQSLQSITFCHVHLRVTKRMRDGRLCPHVSLLITPWEMQWSHHYHRIPSERYYVCCNLRLEWRANRINVHYSLLCFIEQRYLLNTNQCKINHTAEK